MKKLAVLVAAVLCAFPAFAGDKGIVKLSLWDDIAVALPNNTQTVRGIDVMVSTALGFMPVPIIFTEPKVLS